MNPLTISKPLIALAPMDGFTHTVFRQALCKIKSKPDLFFTEFVPVESIRPAGEKTLNALLFSRVEKPIIAQFYGQTSADFYVAAFLSCYLDFDGIDLNLGCSAKKVFSKGGGAGLIGKKGEVRKIAQQIRKGFSDFKNSPDLSKLKLRKEVREKIEEVKQYSQTTKQQNHQTTNFTFSIKTRLGIDQPITKDWISFLASLKPDFISLHGRTVKQGFTGRNNWKEINIASQICQNQQIPLLGNGDIKDLEEATGKIKQYKLAGVLIGRAALSNPWIFRNLKSRKETYNPTKKEVFDFILSESQLFTKIFPQGNFKDLRKHFAYLIKGFKGAKELKMKLLQTQSYQEVKNLVQ